MVKGEGGGGGLGGKGGKGKWPGLFFGGLDDHVFKKLASWLTRVWVIRSTFMKIAEAW